MQTIVFNGKFRSQTATGVQRVAAELLAALGELKLKQHEALRDLDLVLALPKSAVATPLPGFRLTAPGKSDGILWEQIELPQMTGPHPLVNLCNIGPISRQGDMIMLHDAQVYDTPQSYSSMFVRYYRTVTPILARRAEKVLTVSSYSKERLLVAGIAPKKSIDIIPNGVDHVLRYGSDNSILNRLNLRETKYVIAPASVQAHKNIQILLQAARTQMDPDLKLVLYGSADRDTFARIGLIAGPNVEFAGRISDEALRCLVESALAFLFPSLTEGFGLPPLEAMMLKTPAIIARREPMTTLCGEAAIYVDPLEGQAWGEAINLIAKNEQLRQTYALRGHIQAKMYRWEDAAIALAGVMQDTFRPKNIKR